METIQPVSVMMFKKRLVALCLRSGLSGFPKDELDQNILMKSAALVIGSQDALDQQSVDEKLKYWINIISRIQKLDHSSLRRWMVDGGYLTRNPDGSNYRVAPFGPRPGFYAEEVETLDIPTVLREGQEEIERRKREFMEKAGKK